MLSQSQDCNKVILDGLVSSSYCVNSPSHCLQSQQRLVGLLHVLAHALQSGGSALFHALNRGGGRLHILCHKAREVSPMDYVLLRQR